MFPRTALSFVSLSIHAHASVYGGSGIFPSQKQYIAGCGEFLNDGIMHEIVFVIGGRRAVGYGYGDMDEDFASTSALNRRWWRPSSRVLARHRLREAEVQC